MSFLTWFGSLLGKSSKGGTTPPTLNSASIPSLPVGSVAAVADALTEAGRLTEQQMALRNTLAMQQSVQAKAQEQRLNKIEQDVSNEDTNATRNDLAD